MTGQGAKILGQGAKILGRGGKNFWTGGENSWTRGKNLGEPAVIQVRCGQGHMKSAEIFFFAWQ